MIEVFTVSVILFGGVVVFLACLGSLLKKFSDAIVEYDR